MIRYFLSKIYESIVNHRNRKFQIAKIYSSDNIPSNEKYFKIEYKSKIISVGNLSAGGTGKTPLTIEIINSYLPKDKSICIVGRNYRTKTNNEIFTSQNESGELTNPKLLGDEMYLIQSKTNAISVSGPKKYLNAVVAEKKYHPDVMIIDDGFQHQWIKRDLDIVIVDKYTIEKPYVYPRGRLREPLTSLYRADVIMYPENLDIDKIYPYLKKDALLCGFDILIESIYPLFDENQQIENFDTIFIPVVGIANPHRFIQSLDSIGIHYEKNSIKIFDDHHQYNSKEIVSISEIAKNQNASIITTEKDAVKLSLYKAYFKKKQIQVFVLSIRFQIITNKDQFFEKINSII